MMSRVTVMGNGIRVWLLNLVLEITTPCCDALNQMQQQETSVFPFPSTYWRGLNGSIRWCFHGRSYLLHRRRGGGCCHWCLGSSVDRGLRQHMPREDIQLHSHSLGINLEGNYKQ